MDAQPPPVPAEEKTIWQGHSSQVINLPVFMLCGLAVGILLGAAFMLRKVNQTGSFALAGCALIPVMLALGKWTENRCRQYQITTERIHFRRGVVARQTDDLELYRVKDYTLVEPFFLRLFGLGNIVLTTTDDNNSIKII